MGCNSAQVGNERLELKPAALSLFSSVTEKLLLLSEGLHYQVMIILDGRCVCVVGVGGRTEAKLKSVRQHTH